MTLRLLQDPDNWVCEHAERCIDHAMRLFDRYESQVDFDHREDTDDFYRSYQLAREQAVQVATRVQWCVGEATALP